MHYGDIFKKNFIFSYWEVMDELALTHWYRRDLYFNKNKPIVVAVKHYYSEECDFWLKNLLSVSGHLLVTKAVKVEYGKPPFIYSGRFPSSKLVIIREVNLPLWTYVFILQEHIFPFAVCLKLSKYFLTKQK